MKNANRLLHILLLSAALLILTGFANETDVDVPISPRTDCQVGNPVPPVPPPAFDFVNGDEEYNYLIYPPDQCDCPDGGIKFETINMLLEFEPIHIPVAFAAVAVVREALYDEQTGCWVPGEEICVSDPVIFDIQEPGVHAITIPIPDCDCLPFDEHYFIGVRYIDTLLAHLPVDDQPLPCVSYLGDGVVWQDLDGLKRAAGGKVIVWGDLICCDPVIASDATNWSTIKALYH